MTSLPRRNTARIFVELIKAAVPGVAVFPGVIREADEDQTMPGAVPMRAVFVLARGDRDSVPFIDGGAGGAEERPGLTIWCRGNVRDPDDAQDLADDVFRAVDMKPPRADGFFEARCQQSAPVPLGMDGAQAHRFSINVALKRYKPSGF